MRVLIAPDKFKGSLSAAAVCTAIEAGIKIKHPDYQIQSLPLADGGEGTMEILVQATHGSWISLKVEDPLFREIPVTYGLSQDGHTAFIEMAEASGLQRLQTTERSLLETTTLGTGQMIKDALDHGVNHIILGIGGSATNDAGMGMATALGYQFFSNNGEALKPTGQSLSMIDRIVIDGVDPRIGATRFTVLCDVDNPLHGEQGAARVFGPQKGADSNTVTSLDAGLRHFEEVAARTFTDRPVNFPGAGAAGGLGAGASVFLKAELRKGFEFVASYTHLKEAIRSSDFVVTGEGQLDSQTLAGKVVAGVASLCKEFEIPCVAMVGNNLLSTAAQKELALAVVFALDETGIPKNELIKAAALHLQHLSQQRLEPWISSF